MNKDTPVGYQLHITTTEGDGDHEHTSTTSGLIEEDVRFFLEILRNFRYSDGYPVADEYIVAVIEKALYNNPNISESEKEYWNFDGMSGYTKADYYRERLNDSLLGNIENEAISGGKYCRQFERFEVYYVPGPIANVTDKFKI